MKFPFVLILAAAAFLAGCTEKKEEKKPAASSNSSGNPLTAPADYLGALSKAKKATDKTIENINLQQAIQSFYATEERMPKDLNELVTKKYLSALPTPPAGKKFQYDPKTGQVTVVSQ